MSAYNFKVRGYSPTKLWQTLALDAAVGWVLTQVQFLWAPPTFKFGRAKNVQNLVRFTKSFEFDRKYL